MQLAEERSNFLTEEHTHIFNRAALTLIARYLGIMPETFCRLREKK